MGRRALEVVMAVAGSIALIILGAVVAFAVDADIAGLDIRIVGYIIMIVGVVGLVFGLTVRRREQRGDHPARGGQAKP
jgi:hypothetical protein